MLFVVCLESIILPNHIHKLRIFETVVSLVLCPNIFCATSHLSLSKIMPSPPPSTYFIIFKNLNVH